VIWSCQPLPQAPSQPGGHHPTRFCAGLANRMLGIATAFLYGILTSRALLIEWPGGEEEQVSRFLYSPYFHWSVPVHQVLGHRPTERVQDVRFDREDLVRELSAFDPAFHHHEQVVRLTVFESFAEELLRNPALQARALDFGIYSPDDVIGRLLRILFRPKAALRRSVAQMGRVAGGRKTVGLQVRLGSTGGGASGAVGLSLDHLPRFEAAAAEISRKIEAAGGPPVAWLLATDSVHVVHHVKQSWDLAAHPVIWHNQTDSLDTVELSAGAEVLLKTLIDFWSLAMCDEVVITVPSTFGFVARLINITGDTGMYSIFHRPWLSIAERTWQNPIHDTLKLESEFFGQHMCSTVGWAGDLCVKYS